MPDFETKLRRLSERGNPVGAEELIERIEAELAGDPLVVVSRRREGTSMTKTQTPPTTNRPSRSRGLAWAAAIFVAIIAGAGLFFAFVSDRGPVADTVPAPTTSVPDLTSLTDLEIVHAGVQALYSGDVDRAVELFELPPPDDHAWMRLEAPYQALVGGRLDLVDCSQQGDLSVFTCRISYSNVFTEAVGWVHSPGDTVRVVVESGVITRFGPVCDVTNTATCGPDGHPISILNGDRLSGFPEHHWILEALGGYASDSGFAGPDCVYGRSDGPVLNAPVPIECLQPVLDDLDGWTAWAQTNLGRYAEEWSVSPPVQPPPSAEPEGLPVGSEFRLWSGSYNLWEIVVTIPSPGWDGQTGSGILVKDDSADGPDGAGLIVFPPTNAVGDRDLYVYGDPCEWNSTRPNTPVATVDEAVAAFSTQLTRDASAPVDVTVAGFSGKSITLHVPDDAVFTSCDSGEFRSYVRGQDDARYAQDPGQIDKLWILDVNGDLLILNTAFYDGTPQEVVDEMDRIVESAVVTLPNG